MYNPLLDKEFLEKLFRSRERETFIKIISYDKQKNMQDYIEGLATGGSINIDGASSTRRSCSLNIAIPPEYNNKAINDFYWSLCTEFELFVGLKNTVLDSIYDSIIWFPMGKYIVSSFSQSEDLKGWSVNVSGKDKMCLLNGELGGIVTSLSLDIDKYTEADGTIKKLPIETIIRELIKNYGEEPAYNIVINGLDELGLELLEYRGETPMYLFWDPVKRKSVDYTFDGKQKCFKDGKEITVEDESIVYKRLAHSQEIVTDVYTKVKLSGDSSETYEIIKLEYGEIAGYQKVEEGLIFNGDLVLSLGDSVTSAFDKIIEMLGNYEYFYNIDGQFVFQKKQNIIAIPSPQLRQEVGTNGETELFYDAMANSQLTVFKFDDDELFTSKSKSYKIDTIKNDFSVWGKRNERDIYARYAIDNKPTRYISYAGQEFYTTSISPSSENGLQVDWREIIYQMAIDYQANNAKDDFYKKLKENNDYVVNGKTGYEKYYSDISAFWPQVYDIAPEPKYTELSREEIEKDGMELFTDALIAIENKETFKNIRDKQNIYTPVGDKYFQRWIDAEDLIGTGRYDVHELYYVKNGENKQVIESLDFIKNQAYLDETEDSRLFLQLAPDDQQKVYFSSTITGTKKKLQEYLSLYSFSSLKDFIPYNKIYLGCIENGEQKYYAIERIEIPIFPSFDDKVKQTDIIIWQFDENIKQLSEDTVKLISKIYATPGNYMATCYLQEANDQGQVSVKFSSTEHELVILGEYYSKDKILWYKTDSSSSSEEYEYLNKYFLSNKSEYETPKIADKHNVYFLIDSANGTSGFYKTVDLININKGLIKWYDKELKTYFNVIDLLAENYNIEDKTELYYYNPNKKTLLNPLDNSVLFVENKLDEDSVLYNNILKDGDNWNIYFYDYPRRLNGEPYPLITEDNIITRKIKYYSRNFDYFLQTKNDTTHCWDATHCWNKEIYNDFTKTPFWFDFIETDAVIGKFAVPVIGDRIKAEQNEKITAVDFGAIPNIIYTGLENDEQIIDYDLIKMNEDDIKKTFSISAKGYSIQNKIEEYLSALVENNFSMNLNVMPIYNLDANQQIEIKDNIFNISRITIPLSYNGTMSLEVNKIG